MRVKKIAGYCKPYKLNGQKDKRGEHSDGSDPDDELYRNIEWFNESKKKDVFTSYDFVVMNDRQTKRPDKIKDPYFYHFENIFFGFLDSKITYNTDSTAFKKDSAGRSWCCCPKESSIEPQKDAGKTEDTTQPED